MKSLLLALCLSVAPFALHAQDQTAKPITADQLKSWTKDSSKKVVLVDARSKQYFDGKLLPGAIWLPCDSPDDAITKALPSKSSLIVVYCLNSHCPASGCLANKLNQMGYTNVYEFSGGLEEWMKKGYPTTKK